MTNSENFPAAVAVDIGGSVTKIALVSKRGIVNHEVRNLPTPITHDPEALLSILVEEVDQLRCGGGPVVGLGIAVPGLVSDDRGTVKYCPNIPVLVGYPWRSSLTRRLGIPVTLEVDCNAAAMGEHRFGTGRSAARLLVLSLGTGVGCAMLIGGEPLRFTGGCCGDLGHLYVGGEVRCSAGCKGCLESVVSVRALGGTAAGVRELITRAHKGEQRSIDIIRQAGQSVGIAVASMVSCFQPHLVLLAGGIAEADTLITGPANQSLAIYGAPYFQVPIRKALLGASAALAGAAAHFIPE
jgi:glucokinase